MFTAQTWLRIERALQMHARACGEIEEKAQQLGNSSVASSMCKESAITQDLLVTIGIYREHAHAAESASHAAERADVHAAHAALSCPFCSREYDPDKGERPCVRMCRLPTE